MKKQHASSERKPGDRERTYKTVEQAFAHYFPDDRKPAQRPDGRESGEELAERIFQKIVGSATE